MSHPARVLFLLVLHACLLTLVALGQTAAGALNGRVTDPQGAVAPGARVTAVNLGTGIDRSVTTGSEGTYSIINLHPGSYEVHVERSGFAPQKIGPVVVNVGTTTTVDVTLQVAGVSEKVTVTGEAAGVDVKNVTVQSLISEEEISSLPINGRNFQQLAVLSPFATSGNQSPGVNFDSTKTRVGAISVGGGAGRFLNISIDGGDANDDFVGGQNLQISQDAVQEFNIVTQRYNSEDGRATQGILNVITKSGTNDIHGDAFWFFRDNAIGSRTAIEEELNLDKPDFRRQQFGGTIGGPIKKDKAFFFGSFERQQEHQNAVFNSNGAFPTADGLIPQPFHQNMYLAKVTVQATPTLSFFARYAQMNNKFENDQAGILNASPESVVDINFDFHTVLAGLTKVGTGYVNDLRYQYSDYNGATVDPSGNEDAASLIFPSGVFGHNPQSPQFNIQRKHQFRNSFAWQRGKHNLKLGAEYIYQPKFGGEFGFGRNQFFYANDDYDPVTNTVGPTNSIVAFTTFSQPLGEALNPPLHYFAVFAQDEWSITPRVTLNAGLRYDVEKNLFVPRDTPTNQVLYPAIGQPHGDHNNFAPRIGVAIDLTGNRKTVLNAGYGLYYEYQAITSETLYEALNELPNPFEFVFVPPPVPFGPNNIPDFTGTPGFSIGFANAPDLTNPMVHQFSVGVEHELAQNLVLQSSFVGSWGRDFHVLSDFNPIIDPVLGTRLHDSDIPGLGSVQMFVTGARTRYLAWATQIRYRSKRVDLQASYKLSDAKANTDSVQGAAADGVLDTINWRTDPTEFGPTQFDERHRFVASFIWHLPAGFEVSGITNASSARPYTPICSGCDLNGDGFTGFFGVGDRTEPRGNRRGDSTFTLDLRGTKSFRFEDRFNLQFMLEVFNLTNTANFGNNFQRVSSAPNFGEPINIATPPRQAQIAVRFTF